MFHFVNNSRTLQQSICLLVCVCAWRGPIPVLHDHQAMSNPELRAQHAQTFHEGRDVDEITGLHWHLGFPEDLTGEECPIRDESAPELPLFACSVITSSLESGETETFQLVITASMDSSFQVILVDDHAEHRATNAPRSFLETLLNESPLSAVTGVCLI